MKVLGLSDISKEERSDINTYFSVHRRLEEFTNKCSLGTFNILFKDNSNRLWKHYVEDCNRDFHKFTTYLTSEQKNMLFVNAYKNRELLWT